MLDKIKDLIEQGLYHLGFIVKRVPDKNRFFEELTYAPDAVKWHELHKLSFHIRAANDHKLYNEILKTHVPAWNPDFTTAEFTGKGSGEYSLSIYRKVCFEKKYYFEKVYFNGCYDLLKLEWFYEHIYPIIKDQLKTPELYKVIKGDLITIVYSEYIDLIPLPADTVLPVSFEVSRLLLYITEHTGRMSEPVPDYLTQYISHFQYFKNIRIAEKLIEELSSNSITTQQIEQVTRLQPLVITHGDIYPTNVFSGNRLIDWDSFGLFPSGFETALILATQLKNPIFDDLAGILNREYKAVIPEDQWNGFELTSLYFYFVFSASNEKSPSGVALQKEVLNRVVSLYNQANTFSTES